MRILKEPHRPAKNRLLAALPHEEYQRLLPRLERVHLSKGKIIYNVGDTVRHAYFVLSGMLSLLSITEDGSTVEVSMVGDEGMVGVPVILRVKTMPYQVMVQIKVDALKISSAALEEEVGRGGQLQDFLLRYTHSLLTQISQSAVCHRFHTIEQRLCRWLLVARDRVKSNTICLTQECLSHMLGAPRTRVTMTASKLQKQGLISYSRGKITILDQRNLEAASCECYRAVTERIDQFLAA